MNLKRVLSMVMICAITLGSIQLSFAENKLDNPHISYSFEITDEESENCPTNKEIELKESMETNENSRIVYKKNYGSVNLGSSEFLNIRSGPGTGYSVVTKASAWTDLKIVDTGDANWIKVTGIMKDVSESYISVNGYAYRSYVIINGVRNFQFANTTENVNVRLDSSTSSTILATIPKGTRVKKDADYSKLNNGWEKIWRGYNKSSGYCYSKYIS